MTNSSKPPAVLATDLVKSYGMGDSQVFALRGVSLEIAHGERVALLGKSGSGKSTLLNILGGLDRPTSGQLSVCGQDVTSMNADSLALYRLTTTGMIFQSYNLISSRTALQNVELPLIFSAQSPRTRRAASLHALQAVGLGDRIGHRPSELSGGEQQRVAIARALMNGPQLLLADEPTGNLDSHTAEEIVNLLLQDAVNRGSTILLITHDEDLAGRFSDRVLRIQDGEMTGDLPG